MSDMKKEEKEQRAVTPLGWSRAELERLETELGQRLEALIGAVERPACRVRPATATGVAGDEARVLVLGRGGEPLPAKAAEASVSMAARACGLTVATLEDGALRITVAANGAPEATQPQPEATVDEVEVAAPAKSKRR